MARFPLFAPIPAALSATAAVLALAAFSPRVSGPLSGLAPAALAADPEPKALVAQRCTACHNLDRVRKKVGIMTESDWNAYVTRMRQKGAKATDAEQASIVGYLTALPSGKDL